MVYPDETAPQAAPVAVAPKTSLGTLFGIIIIVVLLVVGALYFWGAQIPQESAVDGFELEEAATGL